MNKTSSAERIEYLLPSEATAVEKAQRQFIDYLAAFNYQQVVPPIAASIDDLLAGNADNLSDLTVRLTDPLGGKPIGIRADITPLIRQIDASHFANTGEVVRLCYYGPTLYARPLKPWDNRERLQAGAEIFGGDADQATSEIIMLALDSLSQLGLTDLFIVLGNVAINQAVLGNLPQAEVSAIFAQLAKRDLVSATQVSKQVNPQHLEVLTRQATTIAHLQEIEQELASVAEVTAGFAQLYALSDQLSTAGVKHCFDLATLTAGFEYHNGIIFSVLAGETVISRGGSYGTEQRQACGFSLDLRNLAPLLPAPAPAELVASLREFTNPSWHAKVTELRQHGTHIVLVDNWEHVPSGCTKRLVADGDTWKVS